MKFGLLIAIVGLSVAVADYPSNNPIELITQLVQLENENQRLQQLIANLVEQVADCRYKNQLVVQLRMVQEILKNKCNSVVGGGGGGCSSNGCGGGGGGGGGEVVNLGYFQNLLNDVRQAKLNIQTLTNNAHTLQYTLLNFWNQLRNKCFGSFEYPQSSGLSRAGEVQTTES
ncbi:uncharacterized protein LOC26528050 [Drosophila mojavensis]|uniref:Accessory gland protein 45 n=1 Tax=Drosophila mojavensis TaxID=7230 RepID=A0A0Q9XD99_DROMO|nr:uncharacterized protein LOC26528050 [Drosophila mojavensis]KRG06550.1 uncharacterized protein Dmoj_GI26409 [Drosophila mojavensis]